MKSSIPSHTVSVEAGTKTLPLTWVQSYLTLLLYVSNSAQRHRNERTELLSPNPQTPLLEIKILFLSSSEHLPLSQVLSANNNHQKRS